MSDFLYREFIYLAYYCELQLKQILPYYFLGMVAGSFILPSGNVLTSK